MPQISTKPFKICRVFSCNNLTKDSYCEEHKHIQVEKELKRHRHYNKQRDPVLKKFYNSKEWRMLSQHIMSINHYLCIGCSTPNRPMIANLVDHIVPVLVDWSLRLVPNNCQPLCHDCHNKKTSEDKKIYGNRL